MFRTIATKIRPPLQHDDIRVSNHFYNTKEDVDRLMENV